MALNFCVICDEAFYETEKNPGNLCDDCRKRIEEEKGKQYIPKGVLNENEG